MREKGHDWANCPLLVIHIAADKNVHAPEIAARAAACPTLLASVGFPKYIFLPAVAENQPANKNRMKGRAQFSDFTRRLRAWMISSIGGQSGTQPDNPKEESFNLFALELFALQFEHNPAYRKLCAAQKIFPEHIENWRQIPPVPTSAFKELELSSLDPDERTVVFHSSGTTGQRPSRHFHNPDSLAIYELSLKEWFFECTLPGSDIPLELGILTPSPGQAVHSSLVYMFEILRKSLEPSASAFLGRVNADDSWQLDCPGIIALLQECQTSQKPVLLLGTAFSYVHLLDDLKGRGLQFDLPPRSLALETGGYKGRSRELSKCELRSRIAHYLGIHSQRVVEEYGMSELSSQAYSLAGTDSESSDSENLARRLIFPPWARVQIISPETGQDVAPGQTGLIRVVDLANVYSVMAIQTEDLGIRHERGFECLGRAPLAQARGCSLMAE